MGMYLLALPPDLTPPVSPSAARRAVMVKLRLSEGVARVSLRAVVRIILRDAWVESRVVEGCYRAGVEVEMVCEGMGRR
jgi:hypothetical protein